MRPSEKEALVRSLGAFAAREIEKVVAPLRERIKELEARPAPKDGVGIVRVFKDQSGALIVTLSDGQAVDTGIRDGDDGKPIDPEQIAKAVAEAVAELPVPQDGKSVEPEEIAIAAKVAVAELSLPTRDDLEAIARQAAAEAITTIEVPEAPKGPDCDEIDAQVRAAVAEAVAELPPAEPGKSVTVDELQPVIEAAVEARIAKIPAAKDGVGLAGGIVNRDGNLVLTLTDGSTRELGRVEGKDGDPGKPGLGFDDLKVIHDGERGFTFRLARGDQVEEFAFSIPIVLDRGIWREGGYKAGDGVTWDGSWWVAQAETNKRPGTCDDWRMAAKKGRDGKSVKLEDVKPMIDRVVNLAVNGLKLRDEK